MQLWWKTPDQLLVRTAYVDESSIGFTLLSADGQKSKDANRLAEIGGHIIDPLPDEPQNVLMICGDELGRVNINTGHFSTVASVNAAWGTACWLDGQKRFRATFARDHDGAGIFRWCSITVNDWHSREFNPVDGEYWPLGFDADPRYLWLADSTQGKEVAISRFDTATGECVPVVRRVGLDPTWVMLSGPTRRPIAVGYAQGAKAVLVALNETYRPGIELLQQKYADLFPDVIDATRDPHHWLVFLHNSQVPGVYALFDSQTGDLHPIARSHSAALTEARLAPAELFAFPRRNGAKMTARLWRPAGVAQPPLVVLAPARLQDMAVSDTYNAYTQALVELGYAVIRVNTRGTYGFGKDLRTVPETEIAQTLSDDLDDAVRALADKKIVDGRRVALVGNGISGMLAMLVAKTNQRFAAVVVLNAPAKVTQNDLLNISDSTNLNMLSNRLGWFRSIAIADQMSPVALAPQLRMPALYLYDEEALKGRMIEDGRDIRSATKSANVPAQFDLAYSFSLKPKLATVTARESAVIVIKVAEFLAKAMPATRTP